MSILQLFPEISLAMSHRLNLLDLGVQQLQLIRLVLIRFALWGADVAHGFHVYPVHPAINTLVALVILVSGAGLSSLRHEIMSG